MTQEQFLSLWQWDHNVMHRDGGSDEYWNLTPMFRAEHKEKTTRDVKALAKTQRLQKQHPANIETEMLYGKTQRMGVTHRIPSRGFDKRFTRGFDGKVRPRRERRKVVT